MFLEILNLLKRLKDFVEKMPCMITDASSSSVDVYIYITATQFLFYLKSQFFFFFSAGSSIEFRVKSSIIII